MNDTQLYTEILGIAKPWRVDRVDLNLESSKIIVCVSYAGEDFYCPECNKRMHKHDKKTRRWRHLDSCQYKTIIECEVPRVKCAEHGTVTVAVPWAESNSRFTCLFERFAIDVLQSMPASRAASALRISWDEADGIKQRAVLRGLKRKESRTQPFQIGVDEKSIEEGHNYLTIMVASNDEGKVVFEDAVHGRKEQSLTSSFEKMTASEKELVNSINVDMWEAYSNSIHDQFPNAEDIIVYDRFHVVGHLNKAVDAVRKTEAAELADKGDPRLRKTKYIWLKRHENLTYNQNIALNDLKDSRLKTARAWRIKEAFQTIWDCETYDEAVEYFKWWFGWAKRSKLDPIKKFADMIKAHLNGVLNFFTLRTTNSISESMNSRIQSLISRARGYRNFIRFKTEMLFNYGGLSLKPILPLHVQLKSPSKA